MKARAWPTVRTQGHALALPPERNLAVMSNLALKGKDSRTAKLAWWPCIRELHPSQYVHIVFPGLRGREWSFRPRENLSRTEGVLEECNFLWSCCRCCVTLDIDLRNQDELIPWHRSGCWLIIEPRPWHPPVAAPPSSLRADSCLPHRQLQCMPTWGHILIHHPCTMSLWTELNQPSCRCHDSERQPARCPCQWSRTRDRFRKSSWKASCHHQCCKWRLLATAHLGYGRSKALHHQWPSHWPVPCTQFL